MACQAFDSYYSTLGDLVVAWAMGSRASFWTGVDREVETRGEVAACVDSIGSCDWDAYFQGVENEVGSVGGGWGVSGHC